MTWTTQPYTSLSDVKTLLDPNMAAADDAWITLLIGQAQSDLDAEIGYSFQQDGSVPTPASRTYDGTGQPWLWIDDLVSLAAISGVTETYYNTYLAGGTTWIAGATQTTDITADIKLKPANAVAFGSPYHKLVRNSGLDFAEGTNNYVVSGVWGMPIVAGQTYPGVPNDISRACARLTVYFYKMRDTAYADMVQAQGGVREHYLKTWPQDVLATINNYKRTRFATHSRL